MHFSMSMVYFFVFNVLYSTFIQNWYKFISMFKIKYVEFDDVYFLNFIFNPNSLFSSRVHILFHSFSVFMEVFPTK